MNKKGFTLIEMLVVIAIIAVLVAIVIPVVGSSTDKAGAATNAANLRAVYAELQTDKVSACENATGYIIVTKDASGNLVYALATSSDATGTVPPASAKTVGCTKGTAMSLDATTGMPTYGTGMTIEYFSTVAETGAAPTT